jgi:rhodanese-related sulfurtransferase
MKIRSRGIFWVLSFILLFAFAMPAYGAEGIPRISVKQLNEILSNSELVVLDVRTERDWGNSDKKVVGAVRVNPDDINSWTGNYTKDQKIVLYCA